MTDITESEIVNFFNSKENTLNRENLLNFNLELDLLVDKYISTNHTLKTHIGERDE